MNNTIKIIFVIVITVIMGVIIWFYAYDNSYIEQRIINKKEEKQVTIVLTESGFEPRYVRISKGTTVVFSSTNDKPFWPASNLHPSHAIYSEFDSQQPIDPKESWSFTFEETGDWGFHDHIRSYFNGVIYIE